MTGNINQAVADVQEAVAEQVQEVRAEALEDAATRVAAAEQAARELASSVMATELGGRVAAVERELGACRTEISSLQTRLAEVATAATQPPAPAVIVDNSSTQTPRSSPPADQLPAAQEVIPNPDADAGGPGRTEAPTPGKPKRRLL